MAGKKITNELDADYRLIGVAALLKEYKFCFHLNSLLGCDFRKLKDLSFEPKDRGRTVTFSVFKAGAETDKNQYVVLANKNAGELLLPEAASFDYIVQVLGKYTDDEMKDMVDNIRLFPGVLLTSEIPIRKVKHRDRLVYEEEKPARPRVHIPKFK